MRSPLLVVSLVLAIAACGGYPDPNPDRPASPTENDPAFTKRGLNGWYLVSDGVTPGQDQLTAIITAPSGTDYVDAYIPGLEPIRMIHQDDGFAMDVSIADVPVGSHEILFSANGDTTAFASHIINRSKPYYVLVTTDYDFSDPGDNSISYMDMLHQDHEGLVITHFWAPYTYTDPAVSDARRTQLDAWIKKQRDDFGDEIGLHIHPYCNFVDTAGIACITDQSTTMPAGDTSGYTINLSAYGYDGMTALLTRAKAIFADRDLGTPVTFRAGGWTADVNTLNALSDAGFVADTSALNWARIEEWQGYELYTWNMTNWNPINDTSQPYHPSTTNALSGDPAPRMPLLEVPDNGAMICYAQNDELQGIFNENFDGTPLEAPRTLMMGFHPSSSMPHYEYVQVDLFLHYVDDHSASRGSGPAVFISLKDVTAAFPAL